jgi:hypothetical protein
LLILYGALRRQGKPLASQTLPLAAKVDAGERVKITGRLLGGNRELLTG